MFEKDFKELVEQYEEIREKASKISDSEEKHNFIIAEVEKFSFEQLRELMYYYANKNKEV